MSLENIFFNYIDEFKNLWYIQDSNNYSNLQIYSDEEKRKNENEINNIINSILNKFELWPKNSTLNLEEARKTWAIDFNNFINDSISNISIDECYAIKYFISSGIMDITKSFIKDSLKDQELNFSDIGQAIRNAWIMNILQLMLNIKVEYTPSVYGYSMLYPYTDNLIDSSITIEEKKNFNDKFNKRLLGFDVLPSNKQEAEIYRMVELIESQYKRDNFPEVYESLLLIHTSQINSLKQQTTSCPFEKDIIGISFKKGGSSVLADGYLVKGKLSEQEINFTLGFGIILQLCDDMQDIQSDIDNNSASIFSLSAKGYKLDLLANKLFRLIEHVFTTDIEAINFDNREKIVPFMKQCCNLIVLDGMMSHNNFFTKQYIKTIEKYLPVTPKFLYNIKTKTPKKFNKIFRNFEEDELRKIIAYMCV